MPARGYSSTASTKRNRPAPKRRVVVASPSERAGELRAARRRDARADRLRQQVARERRRVRQGGVRADSRDVTANTAAPTAAERRRAAAADARDRAARERRDRGLFDRVLEGLKAAPGAVGDFISEHAVLAPIDDVSRYGVGPKRKGGRGGLPIGAAVARPVRLKATPVRNLPRDAANFPKDSVISLYELGAAGVEAAQGDTRRARKLAAGLDDGAVGRLVVHGDVKGAAKAFEEHPLYSGLEVTGTGQVLGRGAGAVGRSGVLGKGAKRAAGTKRAPLRVEGTNQVLERRYSANVGVKAAQVARERAQRARGHDPNVARGEQRRRLLNAEVDEFAAQAEGIRRRGREEAVRSSARLAPVRRGAGSSSRAGRAAAAVDRGRSRAAEASALPGVRGRAERDVVLAAVEGRLRGPATFKADLVRERARLQRVYLEDRARPKGERELSAAARQANRAQVAALDRVLGDPRALANAGEVFRAADEYVARAGKVERGLIAKGALDPEQATAARVRTYGVSVMGLRPVRTPRAPAHLEQRHAQAGAAERSARQRLQKARRAEVESKARVDTITGSNRSLRARDRMNGGPQRAYYVGKERFTSRAAADKRARESGERVRPVALNLREADRSGRAAQARRRHAAAVKERREAERAFREAREARAASKPRRTVSGLEDEHGRLVSTEEILRHIRENGDREPGFVGHRRDQRGASSYFVNWYGGRKTVDGKRRTGEAARTGAYDASFAALEEQLVRGQGVLDAIGTFDEFVRRFGSRRRDGRPYTWDEAERAAGELAEATGMDWVPVRAVPARYDRATQQRILDEQGTAAAPGHLDSLTLGRLDDALKVPEGKERGTRNVVLVPAQQIKRFAQHQTQGSSTGGKAGQIATRAFRGTVLPFSTKWLTGNVAEAVLRSVTAGVGPLDVLRGRRVLRELRKMDEAAWRQADTRIRGGLLYGSGDRVNVRRASEDFAGTALHRPAVAAEMVARVPVVRQTLGGLRMYQRSVFALNRGLERAFQTGVIGKVARQEAQELTGSWARAVRLQEDVAREVARGLIGTPKQVQFARAADEILGKYGRFSPSTRRVIQTFAPFLPWFLNAARFVGYTLPIKHPAKAALLANVEVTLEDEIRANRELVPPGDLESAIRRKDGGLVNLARYTPFGAFTKGPAGLADPLLPQIDSVVAALNGRSFTGKPLRLASGEEVTESKKLWLALYTLAEGAIPGVQIARRIQEKGGTPFDDSTVFSPKTKPDTARSGAADRILNPLRPTYLQGGGGGGAPASPADEREARELVRQQESPAAVRERRALEREARALLRLQGGVR